MWWDWVCGGGQKDTRLLNLLRQKDRQVAYTPSDVSTAMVLVARESALGGGLPAEELSSAWCAIWPWRMICEKVLAEQTDPDMTRLITFLG